MRKHPEFESLPLRFLIFTWCYLFWQMSLYVRRSTQVGRRGAPAKGVGRVTGARVQISPSPEQKASTNVLAFWFLGEIWSWAPVTGKRGTFASASGGRRSEQKGVAVTRRNRDKKWRRMSLCYNGQQISPSPDQKGKRTSACLFWFPEEIWTERRGPAREGFEHDRCRWQREGVRRIGRNPMSASVWNARSTNCWFQLDTQNIAYHQFLARRSYSYQLTYSFL